MIESDVPPRSVSVLGATGSVGQNTIDLIERFPERYSVISLTGHTQIDELAAMAKRVGARFVVTADDVRYAELKSLLSGEAIEVAAGRDALVEAAAREADWTMAAIVGAAGLRPTLAAIKRGGLVALANKECLVCAGDLMMAEVRRSGSTLLPVDSEHNAIFQSLGNTKLEAVDRLVLTASGGPFRCLSRSKMACVTPAEAVQHPNWDMGAKISIDSATMMNKGLELIEAHYLFQMQEDCIDIVIHPQSLVHSVVQFKDGSMIAQLGAPDMRIPISHTLAWPERLDWAAPKLDLSCVGKLDFEKPDDIRFPAIQLSRDALRAGGSQPTLLNAANEVAVKAFMQERIGFLDIPVVVEKTLETAESMSALSIDDVISCDSFARRQAEHLIAEITRVSCDLTGA